MERQLNSQRLARAARDQEESILDTALLAGMSLVVSDQEERIRMLETMGDMLASAVEQGYRAPDMAGAWRRLRRELDAPEVILCSL